MNRLSYDSLKQLSEQGTKVPAYLKATKPEIGIVHLGPGAFFRGHQSWYTHKAMELAGGNWGICCVSMRSPGVADALNPQNGLYTLAVLDAETTYEVVGSVQKVLVAKQDYDQVLSQLSAETTKFVTMTITEKGYCLDSEGELDIEHADIQADLNKEQKISAIGLLVEALAERHAAGFKPFVTMSCDNLTDNGKKLRKAIIKYASLTSSELADWLDKELISPCSMVDSITPATNDELRRQISDTFNIEDSWPIKREAFVQWVIEDCLPEQRPAWQQAGATFTSDVRGFENAKLRLLNCPHSTMAYLGVLLNVETVYDAMQDEQLVSFIKQLISNEVIPSFVAPKELDVEQYSEDILNRFRNPAIMHLLAQIAWDGSQKLPMRILPIIEHNLEQDLSIKKLSVAVAAWLLFIRKRHDSTEELVDPLAEKMLSLAAECTNDPANDVERFLSLEEVFGSKLPQNSRFKAELVQAYGSLLPVLSNKQLDWETLAGE